MPDIPSFPKFGAAIPILRVADARASERFYGMHFGFIKDWEHQFEPGFPLMMSLSNQDANIFLSEHSGTGTDRCEIYIYVSNVDAIYGKATELGLRNITTPVDQVWGVREITVTDLDQHQITFGQRLQSAASRAND